MKTKFERAERFLEGYQVICRQVESVRDEIARFGLKTGMRAQRITGQPGAPLPSNRSPVEDEAIEMVRLSELLEHVEARQTKKLAEIMELTSALSPIEAEVILGRYVHRLSVKEVQNKTGLGYATVSRRTTSGLRKIEEILDDRN